MTDKSKPWLAAKTAGEALLLAKALSGADAYLKHAITEATNEAYQRGKADERAAVVAYLRSPRIGCTFEADEVEKGEHEVKR